MQGKKMEKTGKINWKEDMRDRTEKERESEGERNPVSMHRESFLPCSRREEPECLLDHPVQVRDLLSSFEQRHVLMITTKCHP